MSTSLDMHDVVIIGGGPAGLSAALSLEALGLNVILLDPAPLKILQNPSFDGREIALTHHSVSLMKAMGVWDRINPQDISLLKEARVENGDENHPLIFDTKGKDEESLGYLVPNYLIRQASFEEVRSRSGITVLAEDSCHKLRCFVDYVTIEHNGGTMRAKLAVVGDGRFSKVRDSLGIGYHLHDFHRHMMVCRVKHDLPHNGVALQWFDKGQTIALLPLNGNVSSIVLSLPPEEMNKVRALDDVTFNADMMRRLQGRLGTIEVISSRHVYPLKTVFANRFETRHTALIGDTAIGMHPITAHGYNFALLAQEILAQEVKNGLKRGEDLGNAKQLRLFERRLRMKTIGMFTVTNTIATLYTREEKGLWHLRQAGLRAANLLKPIKDRVVDRLIDKGMHLPFSK
ncbi:5-demethoxyubiquinol-8 5-hydroxylase UbiM [Commensalibacter oyaizuii]|uniref:5-demethoxyubiquinol-8 5-hydroxylase UbiM n=1 Tax=Commensalibacter oyaizuii TaxID=3043873 RepID=A0ABT6Q057_9PROT|nr:5-demethoxyubiquinol-8 5-hydroxylase UbiM [Commensalibacter sp. TBRC 16381]MDI2090500.1 5-demethoxyubiquinol-8 5-hydroxylase UbiM [Commensalibacter sp. TBRC 16381]